MYLTTSDTDYVSPGVTLTTSLIIRASAIIDGYCKRSLDVTSYTERVPLTDYQNMNSYQRGHLSYYPVIDVTLVKGRPLYNILSGNIFGPPPFEPINDLSILDIDKNIGNFICGFNIFGVPYSELEVTYTSGWAVIPEAVKVACGMIASQLANNANPNVKAKKDLDSAIEYFGNSMVTPEIADLLSLYILRSFR
ncbi:MAG: hypothetical protein JWM44_1330 [Bacilli bacterium]|nr:hypothetical protein [Bacilli bacterium]